MHLQYIMVADFQVIYEKPLFYSINIEKSVSSWKSVSSNESQNWISSPQESFQSDFLRTLIGFKCLSVTHTTPMQGYTMWTSPNNWNYYDDYSYLHHTNLSLACAQQGGDGTLLKWQFILILVSTLWVFAASVAVFACLRAARQLKVSRDVEEKGMDAAFHGETTEATVRALYDHSIQQEGRLASLDIERMMSLSTA